MAAVKQNALGGHLWATAHRLCNRLATQNKMIGRIGVQPLTMRTLPAVRQAVDRATCLNGQRVWKTNIAMQELTVANKARLAKCCHCHPGVP